MDILEITLAWLIVEALSRSWHETGKIDVVVS